LGGNMNSRLSFFSSLKENFRENKQFKHTFIVKGFLFEEAILFSCGYMGSAR
jgi:hypothetical protein